MAWLNNWKYRRKITIDNINIDSNLSHFPVPVVLGTSVGKSNQDISDVFDQLSIDVDDDFTGDNDDLPNPDLWTLIGNQRKPYISSNKVRLEIDNSSLDELQVYSKFYLSGDFDIQVDFDLILHPNTNTRESGLYLYSIINSNDQFTFNRRYYSGDGEHYYANNKTAGSWGSATKIATTEMSGKFKIVRAGSTFTASKWNGTSWDVIRSGSGPTVNMFVFLWNKTTINNQSITTDFDNFTLNSGTVVWPENTHPNRKKIAITKDDGVSQLYGEIEHWDDENKKAVIWVSKHDLVLSSSGITDLYLYYDPLQDNNDNYIGHTAEENIVTNITGDDFTGATGNLPNEDLWTNRESSAGSNTIQANKLELLITTPSADEYTYVYSKFKSSGDFDIQVDVSDWAGSVDGSGGELLFKIDNDNLVYSKITYNASNGGNVWVVTTKITGSATTVFAARTNNYGKLRLVRLGSTIKAYYDDGNTGWNLLQTCSGFSIIDTNITLGVWTPSGVTTKTSFDNFIINSGTIKYSPAQRVWDDNFKAVYHMAQDPDGDVADSILDSTIANIQLTPVGTMLSEDFVAADIGKAIDFDGINDYLTSASSDNDGLNLIDIITLEVVYKPNISGIKTVLEGLMSRQHHPTASQDSWALFINTSSKLQFGSYGGNIQGQTITWDNTKEYYLAGTYNATGLIGNLFHNGVIEALTNNNYDTMTGATNSLLIGSLHPTLPEFVVGKLSEIRISDKIRINAWIKATNYALKDSLNIFANIETYVSVLEPEISPGSGQYYTNQKITLTCGTSGAFIYYTIDGSDPDDTSLLYINPIPIFSGILKVVSYLDPQYSNIITATYTLYQVDTPNILPGAGEYYSTEQISISTTTNNSNIYYTTDGRQPNAGSNLYSGSFPLGNIDVTIRAIALKEFYLDSAVREVSYTIVPTFEVDWKKNKAKGSWRFEPTNANNRYNIGDKIVTSKEPVWDLKDTKKAITETHMPCGYWINEIRDQHGNCSTTLYPVEDFEEMELALSQILSATLADIVHRTNYTEALDLPPGQIQAGTLRAITVRYDNYPEEEIEVLQSDILSGTLKIIVIRYNNYPLEEIEVMHSDVLSGTLEIIVIRYTHYATEEMEVTHSQILSGTLI